MTIDLAAAKSLLANTNLTAPERAFGADAVPTPPNLDSSKPQTLVVSSDVMSFTTGVEADFRQALADSSLFAQLAAKKKLGADADPMVFFETYFDFLTTLGWMMQERETHEIAGKGDGLEVHEAIIGVITAFLGNIPGAAAAVVAVLDGLHKMNDSAPFITLFNKQSSYRELAQFSFTYVFKDPQHGLMAKAAAFALKADSRLTQVLFFKLHKDRASFRESHATMSIDTTALEALRPQLTAKMNAFRAGFIADTPF
jgi:hypothetical protein